MYAALLEEALGSDVDVICPSSSGENSKKSGELDIEPLLPEAWNRIRAPIEPTKLLAALKDALDQSSRNVVFVLTPWLSFREMPDRLRAEHGRLGLHEIALLIAAERARDGITIASLVPYATVASDSSRPFRAEFFTRVHPTLVLTHDGVASEIGLHSNFRTATIAASASEVGVTRFFRVAMDCSEGEAIADLKRLLAREGGRTSHGYVVRDPLQAGSSLSHDLRSPELADAKLSLEHLGELRKLEEVFEVRQGLNVALEPDRLVDVDSASDLPLLIEGRSVKRGGIEWELARHHVRASDASLLRPGDVLIRAIAAPSDGRLTVAECPEGMPSACAASTVIVLRPRSKVTLEQIRVAVQYLNSRLAMRVVHAMGAGGHHVSRGALGRILVPVPDEDLVLALRELGEAATQFRAWAEDSEQASSDVFEEVGPEEWREQVLRAGSRVRERERAARQVDDLGFRVRTLYPHPLAHLWRVVEASRSDYEGYKTVLETTETLFMYTAVLALVGARAIDEPVPWIEGIADRLSTSPDRGLNMGDWLAILTQIKEGRAIRARAGELPFPEVLSLWTTDDAQAALDRLKHRRDDDGHVRRPEASELELAYGEVRVDMAILFAEADFLVEYPLRSVETTRWKSVDDSTEYDYRDLRGDHHMVPLETGRVPSHRIEQGSLYVATRREQIHRVTPILVREACPQCRTPHTFCFDKLDRASREPVYRGLEYRHSSRRPDLVEDLQRAGFLLVA